MIIDTHMTGLNCVPICRTALGRAPPLRPVKDKMVCTSIYPGLLLLLVTVCTGSMLEEERGLTCADKPCSNNGMCVDKDGSYFCRCATGKHKMMAF